MSVTEKQPAEISAGCFSVDTIFKIIVEKFFKCDGKEKSHFIVVWVIESRASITGEIETKVRFLAKRFVKRSYWRPNTTIK